MRLSYFGGPPSAQRRLVSLLLLLNVFADVTKGATTENPFTQLPIDRTVDAATVVIELNPLIFNFIVQFA